jgi:prophage regulatory protein
MPSDPQFIRRPEVLRITGLKKSTLYELMRLDVDPFPPNYPISERSRAWIKAEVIDWCERRRNADRKLTSIEKTVQLRLAGRGSM